MARKTNAIALALGSAISLGMAAMALAQQAPSASRARPMHELREFGVTPLPAIQDSLLEMNAVQQELKMTDAQKKEQAAIRERESPKIQQARLNNRDRAKFLAARNAIFNETAAAIQANLKPEQRQRLDQIQLQAQGPLAFARPDFGPSAYTGPPLSERLKLSDDQARRIRAIVEEGDALIAKASVFPIPLDPEQSADQRGVGPQTDRGPRIPGSPAKSPTGRPRRPRRRHPSHRRGPHRLTT